MENKVLGGIMGLCVADALGVPVEFTSREVLKKDPVINMRSYGTYHQPVGTWSDDTSMTLCLADNLTVGINYNRIMKSFLRWMHEEAYTPHGKVFDIGIATRKSLQRYENGVNPLDCGGTHESDNGNGALMRILPILFYVLPIYGSKFTENKEAMNVIHNVSSLTHAHKRSLIACGIYISIAAELINPEYKKQATVKSAVDTGLRQAMAYYRSQNEFTKELCYYERLISKDFSQLDEQQIKSTGYVVDTLEAAIWCLLNTTSYKECVLKAVNLGDDTDTVAAVAGGLAGLFYGYNSMPEEWLAVIVKRDYVEDICNKLHASYFRNSVEKLCKYIPILEIVKEHHLNVSEAYHKRQYECLLGYTEYVYKRFL